MSVPNVGPTKYRDGGNRGGAASFKWEDVKQDVHRTNYLGNSLKARVGRFGENREVDWWSKSRGGETKSQIQIEKDEIRKQEKLAMEKALGIRSVEKSSNDEKPHDNDKKRKKEHKKSSRHKSRRSRSPRRSRDHRDRSLDRDHGHRSRHHTSRSSSHRHDDRNRRAS